jgi:hypothetical protein
MKKLLVALIAAGFAWATVGALAADKEPYTAQPKIEKPGRAADEQKSANEVKSGAGIDKKYGRAAEDTAGTPPKSTKKHHSKKKKSTAPAPTTPAEPKQ